MISIIVAIAENYAIGKDNRLLWHISEDLKRFKRLTTGNTVIMGRKTWLSLPKRPLPNRLNVVLTKNPKKCSEGCVMVDSIEAALEICSQAKECFIIGGETVYRQMMPLADRLYVTRINKSFEADTFFPEISPEHWKLTYLSEWKEMDDKSFSYRFEIWDKKED